MTSSVRCRTLIFSWFLRHSPRHVPQGNLVYSTTSMLSSSIIRYILPYRKHSAAVQSTRTSSKASTRRSERGNASKQSCREPACMSWGTYPRASRPSNVYRKHSTAQSALHKSSKARTRYYTYVPIGARQRKRIDRVAEIHSTFIVENLSMCSQRSTART